MKKKQSILITAILALGLAACSTPAATTSAAFTATPVSTAVQFADPVLEAMVRGVMGKAEGDISTADAEAVTRLNLSNTFESNISDAEAITDIHGLEKFSNLEFLDLSYHAISDISALAGMTKLNLLALGGNPVSDISALAGMTNLKGLILSHCAAQDYSPLAELAELELLMLDNSTITDISALAGLSKLRHLYLADCDLNDFSALTDIYPQLESKDFKMAATLEELGFNMNYENHQANYDGEEASVTINHADWGAPPMEWDKDLIRVSMYREDGSRLDVGLYGDLGAYVFSISKEGQPQINYVYDTNNGINVEPSERDNIEQAVRRGMEVLEGEDALLAPIRIFDDILQSEFNMTAGAVYALPFGPPTLKLLGFYPDESDTIWRYEQREERDVNIEILRPEGGESDYDLLFYMALSEEYRMVVTYRADEKKFVAGVDDNEQGGADFTFYSETQEHVDGTCSKNMSVEEYFSKAFNDPAIEDIYLHAVELVQQYIRETFGMSVEELNALPKR